jgi:hypothetical protein
MSPDGQSKRVRIYVIKLGVLAGMCLLADHSLFRFFRSALDHYRGFDVDARVLLVGHSHTELGLDKCLLEQGLRVPVAKYALDGASTFDRYVMVRHYFSEKTDPPGLVIYDVDAHTFTNDGLSRNSYRLLFPYMDNPVVDEYIRRNAHSSSEYLVRKFLPLSRFDEAQVNAVLRGLRSDWSNRKIGRLDVEVLKKKVAAGQIQPIRFDRQNAEVFEETISFIRHQGAVLVLLYIPTFHVYNDVEPQGYAEAVRMFEHYAQQDNGVVFLNYNPLYAEQAELFYDPIHLNAKGREVVTRTLIRDLQGHVPGRYASNRVCP